MARYATLADFLAGQMLTIDATTDDGWGAMLPVTGRSISSGATDLFTRAAGEFYVSGTNEAPHV